MRVVLAEKPSVARDLAAYLNATSRRDGYLEGGGYQVTWAFGHLVELKEPGDYDPKLKRWTLESLPFVPENFQLRLRQDDGAKKQFAIIKRLFKQADSLICATDAGREGELIFRYIQTLAGCSRKPARRLWLSSLTPSAIKQAFDSIRPLSDYDNLYAAAKCRSQADWVVGLNATRNYTVRHRSSGRSTPSDEKQPKGLLWSLGRVQTPVLAMIVRRDDEIRTFVSEPFWELFTKYRNVQFRHTGDRFKDQQKAEQQKQAAAKYSLEINKIVARAEKSLPPQLYDLTELQRDMNRRFGISAADTLAAAQSLYEAKLITYPRTDSQYLSQDMRKEVPKILGQLRAFKPSEIGKLDLNKLAFNSRIINDAKITDHHAIIPTGATAGGLGHQQKRVYEAVVTRFIAAFYPACEKQITTIDASAGKIKFKARGVRVVIPGWTILYPRKEKETDDSQSMPEFKKGESGPHEPWVKAGQTSPPKHFNENTLLGAMDTAGKFVEEAELREALKEKGLGTPATRAATIETLLRRKYIDRQKKNIVATDLGRYLIAIVTDRNLTSPELTGEWEAKLKQIERGQLSSKSFMDEIAQYTRGIVQSDHASIVDPSVYGDCPRCGQKVIAGKKALGCSAWRKGCQFVLSPNYADTTLTMTQLRELLQLGSLAQPITTGDGDQCLLILTKSGKIAEVPLPQGNEQSDSPASKSKHPSGKKTSSQKSTDGLGPCPLCGSPVIETPRSFGCSKWQDGCGMTIWKTISGKKISITNVKKLLSKRETPIIKGFRSKAGKKFDAKLKLVDGKVQFKF
ncbi:DNA topoisomerase 3 [Rubripirellula obstinata]|uniref:DNA topoisomerase n=1 Tax=Rubripirellula obstinata TaxID=406547 RepID=A0A5B1CJW6_9BACT|nr:type IA DNA topoisomerase [Rubripirellula obstinata]KAA1260866.1 DNA topoisomerase 3 [Rubripirellula obstinata]